MTDDVLERFSPVARAWFDAAFDAPTDAQLKGWASISRGDHTLILAPTGSGKTLAAFLWALDRLLTGPPVDDEKKRCRVLYVSPLKALTYDVERNLRGPLIGMGNQAARLGEHVNDVRVGIRTGDTSSKERRELVRNPPDILVTTPESLYLMLTSQAREILTSVEHVIIDEIHAVAATKRGAHLALTLERLERVAPDFQRIGLSATQRPLDEVARFLGGVGREVTAVDAGVRKQLELEVVVPVEDMAELGRPAQLANEEDGEVLSGPAAGDPTVRNSIWPSIDPVLLELIKTHTSTLIFVNGRGLAERLAGRLNDLAGEELVRAHHGSIARDQRLEIEDALKAGKLPGLVATSTLELGIDMGSIDLVVLVASPPSVASGLQRVGRAGHQVGEPSKGKLFPRFRGDLLVSAVTAKRMQDGLIEETRVPRNPIDVLAQQIVAMVAADEQVTVDEVFETMTRAYPFADLARSVFEGVLDMLAGRYPSDEFAEFRPRVTWDRIEGVLTPRQGARTLAVTSGGTIPDRGLYTVFTPEGGRVGELDEEMVYESREGETFVLGATTWRIEEITRDRVMVTPAPGEPGKLPFWRGDGIGRPYELGRALGEFLRTMDAKSDEELMEGGLDALAVKNLRAFVDEEREVTGGVLPTDRQIVVERFRDELGDWRICILSPFGSQVHAPWSLAIESMLAESLGYEVQTLYGDDGIVIRLPDADDVPPLDQLLPSPDDVEDRVVSMLSGSSLFSGRFRENAARALLLPRRSPDKRRPLWQMRQKAADLQRIALKYPSFPILLETYRECLRDVFDLPALVSLLTDIEQRKVRVVSVDTTGPSPFAGSLVWSWVQEFYDLEDAPIAERRAQALVLDRRMLAELLGSDELRELIDPDALARLEDELQALDERRWARSPDDAADLLRRLGDLDRLELRARSHDDFAEALLAGRRAIEVRIAGEARLVAIEDAGRYRDGLGVALPPGIPDAFLEPVPDAFDQLVRRWARTHGPFTSDLPAARFGVDRRLVDEVLARLEAEGRVLRGAFRPEGREREWVDDDVLRVLRQRSLAALRKEVEPAEVDALVRFLPAWQGVRSEASGLDRLYEVVSQLQGVPIPASVLERDVLPSRMRDYSPRLLDDLCTAGEVVWVGAGSLGRDDGKVRLYLRGSPLAVNAPLGEPPEGEEHDRIRHVLAERGTAFFRDLAGSSDRETLDALWDLVWAGEVTNDSFAPVRAISGGRKRVTKPKGGRKPRLGTLTVLGPPSGQGRWSLVQRGGADPTVTAHALATSLLERHGVLTREAVRGEGIAGGFASVYPILRAMEDSGRVRRGYFVSGLGGAQFAVAGAVDRLRSFRDPGAEGGRHRVLLLAATDPANAYGVAVPWPEPVGAGGRPQRVAGAYVVLLDGIPSLFVERRAKGLVALRPFDGSWEAEAVGALDELVADGRFARLVIERVDVELEPVLKNAGYTPTPKGWTLYR
ncbi:MAG TPA: DEAD/DEAH box helicase [Acidimicrobiales bacterium]|nr:DEAD/DEAH box helicase [Acidimicrobiales bacterium]